MARVPWTRGATTLAVLLAASCSARYRAAVPAPRTPLVATSAGAVPDEPALAPSAPFALGAIEQRRLPNGLTVIVLRRVAPNVAVVLANRAASRRDTRAFRGLDQVMARMLLRATRTSDGTARSILSAHDVDTSVESLPDGLLVSARLAPAALPRYLPTLARAIRSPAFAEDDLALVLADAREEVRSTRRSVGEMVERRLARAIYRRDDRRAHPEDGGLRGIDRIAREHLEVRHRQTFVPGQTVIVVTGAVEPEETFAEVERAFGDWEGRTDAPREIRSPSYVTPPRRLFGITAGTRQSRVRVRDRAPASTDPDHAAFLVIERMLGRMFSARLNLELREELGASYGFHAQYVASSTEGEIELATSVDPSATVHVLHRVVQELRRMRGEHDGGVRAEELAVARAQARAALVERTETTHELAREVGRAFLAETPPSAIEDRIRAVEGLTAEDVHAAARRWLRPDHAPIVVVSRFQVIHGPVRFAGLGDLESATAPSGRSY